MRAGQKRDRARALRAAMTDAERALWRCLRLRQLAGHRFRRQVPIGPFVADFACLQAGLVVEVDGGQHAGARGDRARDAFFRAQGFRVLRFWNHDVPGNAEGVCEVILEALGEAG
ncbi:very-short-patch-repair endonuclease [Luteimonas sp. J16]|uniref:endonuclease domain-containing protein n=1 Tax=unclassified Luteimonas TaxID=2629088 RepID=UPI000479D38C|nr:MULTISPECIES: endonuclease domain-containing protein [unclassified Luteimonas]TWG93255.1 very-short-patch-repair endonuclease [Luteimonas sp. J16]